MNMKSWLRYLLIPAYKPSSGIQELVGEKRKLAYGLSIYLFLGILYEVAVYVAYSKGVAPAVAPFLVIPVKDYYLWQLFYQVPFFLLINILFAGIARLLSLAFGGRGSFEDLLCVVCAANTFPMFVTMWLPEMLGFLFFPGRYLFPAIDTVRQILGILWPIVIAGIGVARVEKIGTPKGVIISFLTFIPLAMLMVVFIR
jgi:hypothetical protein